MTKMSVSASAENLATDAQGGSYDGGSMCLELALEGERLCKAGDCRAGVAFFKAAIQAGTDDLRTLSAIYSQLGNAYFYLGDYAKAMQFHRHDLTLARTMGDKLGEAKASGNLGNTLKVMGKFLEAIQCCKRHLDISQELGDRLSEGRALYNLGNVYHAQGKQLGRVGQNDPGHFAPEVRDCLMQAISFYEQNLYLMRSLGDKQACGRACGNLGNTCYLLGDFGKAIKFHTERLQIAQEFADRAAERRANSNLGNSHIFLGQFENAAEHYKRTLQIAEELGDAAVEAQACYSLGNTYTLLREYRSAEQFHSRHLTSARKLQDRVGEGRACWSLGNAHAALGNHEKALYFASEHYNISKELGDSLGMATAKMNMGDLRKVLGLPEPESDSSPVTSLEDSSPQTPFNALRVRRQSMEQLSLIQITPDGKRPEMDKNDISRADSEENPAESFFDLLSRCQSERMDDQRATLNANNAHRPKPKNDSKLQRTASGENKNTKNKVEMVNLICALQYERVKVENAETKENLAGTSQKADESALLVTYGADNKEEFLQRVSKAASLPGSLPGMGTRTIPSDDFMDMIARIQGTRIEDQRAELPPLFREFAVEPKAVPTGDSSLSVAGASGASAATGASVASGGSDASGTSGGSGASGGAGGPGFSGRDGGTEASGGVGGAGASGGVGGAGASGGVGGAGASGGVGGAGASGGVGGAGASGGAGGPGASDRAVAVAKAEVPRKKEPKADPDEAFFNFLFQAQSGRLDDQRATIPAPKPAAKK